MSTAKHIAIVGAGAAGLSAAHFLQRRGHQVTLFEGADRPGGKCLTVTHGDSRFDLGAVIVAPGYDTVHSLAREYEVTLVPAPRMMAVRRDGSHQERMGNPTIRSLQDLRDFGTLVRFYLRNRHFRKPGYHGLRRELAETLDGWLRKRKLTSMRSMVVPPYTGYGYGYAWETPIGYLLKVLMLSWSGSVLGNVRALRAAFRANGWAGWRKWLDPLCIAEGYGGLCDAMAKRFDVRLSTPVLALRSNAKGVTVHTAASAHFFDAVVVSAPPKVALGFFEPSAPQVDVLEMTRTLRYHSLLIELDAPPPHEAWFIQDNTMEPGNRDRTVLFAQTHADQSACIAYTYAPAEATVEAVEAQVREEAEAMGLEPGRILEHRQWDYFPHAESRDFLSFHYQIEALQGQDHIYFTGEMMAFASVEHVMAYSKDLAERFF